MPRKGPLVTLLGGAALAGVLLVASVNATTGDDGEPDPAAAGQATSPPPAASPGPDESPPSADSVDPDPLTYVGAVDQGGASVAVVINGEEATAYVCDGAEVEAWMAGTARNGELLLDGDGAQLVGSYNETEVEGRTNAGGQDWTFAIEAVDPPEGLYQVADTIVGGAEVEGGWIVLPDGTQVGLLTVDGETDPAPTVDTRSGQVEVSGETVTADRVG